MATLHPAIACGPTPASIPGAAGRCCSASTERGGGGIAHAQSTRAAVGSRSPGPPPGGAGGCAIPECSLNCSCGAPMTLEELQPDVLHKVLGCLRQQDVANIKMCSSRLRANVLKACQHWAPKVEALLLSEPSGPGLLKQLRDAAAGAGEAAGAGAAGPAPKQQQPTTARERPAWPPCAVSSPPSLASSKLDWRQVWSCLERAQSGPWQLDVRRLHPSVAPHGVLLTFELLLTQPAPAEPGSAEQPALSWKDSVPVMSFVLDGKAVEIVVDASGRVTSPQRDWCQGSITLQAGQPRLLALEVSYIFPVPAWFLHPCTLAAPRLPSGGSGGSGGGGGSSSSSSSCCSSSMQLDGSWDSYSTMTGSSASMSIAHSAALCSSAMDVSTGSSSAGGSLARTSVNSSLGGLSGLASSGSGGSSGAGSGHASSGRPRLSLDLSQGFGSYVIDPRYMDDAASPNLMHRGLERLELAGRVCWRPSKVQTWLGRLLPGIRTAGGGGSGGGATGGGSGGGGGAAAGAAGAPGSAGAAAGSPGGGGCSGGGGKPGLKPSFAVTVSKAAAWQVPADPDHRFTAEGFMFWAVQHKAELLLEHYGILPRWMGRRTQPA